MVLSCVNLPIKTHWSIYFKRMQLLTHILCNNELNFWNAQCLFLDTEHTHRYLTHKQFFSVNATLWKCISSYHHSTERVNKWHTRASLFSFYSIPHLPSWNPEDTCGSHRNAWHLLFQSKFNMWPLKSITTHKKKNNQLTGSVIKPWTHQRAQSGLTGGDWATPATTRQNPEPKIKLQGMLMTTCCTHPIHPDCQAGTRSSAAVDGTARTRLLLVSSELISVAWAQSWGHAHSQHRGRSLFPNPVAR